MFSTTKENESSVPQTSTWESFKQYAKHGIVPAKVREGVNQKLYHKSISYHLLGNSTDLQYTNKELTPENIFYKSVYYVDSVVGRIKNALFGVRWYTNYSYHLTFHRVLNDAIYTSTWEYYEVNGVIKPTVFALTNIVLQSLYLAFAYLSYWLAKGLSKVTDKFDLKDKTESFISYSNILSDKAEEHSTGTAEFVNKILSYVFTSVIWILALPITPIIWLFDKCTSSKVSEMEKPEQVQANDAEISNACPSN